LVAAGGLDPLERLDEHDRAGRALAIRTRLAELLRDEAPLLTAARFEQLLRDLTDEVSGLGPLEPLLTDPRGSEVMLNGPGEAVGGWRRAPRGWGAAPGRFHRRPPRGAGGRAARPPARSGAPHGGPPPRRRVASPRSDSSTRARRAVRDDPPLPRPPRRPRGLRRQRRAGRVPALGGHRRLEPVDLGWHQRG